MADGGFKFQPKKTGLSAILADQSNIVKKDDPNETKDKIEKPMVWVKPEEVQERIRIIFDDSGSMSGQAIADAREGVVEFMRNCGINQTAVAIHPMNHTDGQLGIMTTNLPTLSVLVKDIEATAYTPLFQTLGRAQAKGDATRYIIFSDGQPDTRSNEELYIAKAVEMKTPIDTVYISNGPCKSEDGEYYGAAALMKSIADRTGGIFLVFEKGKANFKKAFKYLAPSLRLQLTSEAGRQALMDGKLV